MNYRREFEIPFVGLKSGIHNFEYNIDNTFFIHYGEQDFKNCTANIKLELDKKNSFLLLKFDIDGSVEVNCDRCGNPLKLQLWDEFKVMVKLADDPKLMNEQEEDPDVYYISKGEGILSVEDWIYEFINLSLPMQKMCAVEDIGGPQCNKEVLEKLKKMENDVQRQNYSTIKGLEQLKKENN